MQRVRNSDTWKCLFLRAISSAVSPRCKWCAKWKVANYGQKGIIPHLQHTNSPLAEPSTSPFLGDHNLTLSSEWSCPPNERQTNKQTNKWRITWKGCCWMFAYPHSHIHICSVCNQNANHRQMVLLTGVCQRRKTALVNKENKWPAGWWYLITCYSYFQSKTKILIAINTVIIRI